MFCVAVFSRSIALRTSEVGANVREVVEDRARALTEGVCGEHGYVRPGSMRMISLSHGVLSDHDMGGAYLFDATFRAEVCNPVRGMRVTALVRSANRFGVLCEAGYYAPDSTLVPVMEIVIVKRPVNIDNEVDISDLSAGDEVGVEILGRSYDMRDSVIAAYGRTVRDVDSVLAGVAVEEESSAQVPPADEDDHIGASPDTSRDSEKSYESDNEKDYGDVDDEGEDDSDGSAESEG